MSPASSSKTDPIRRPLGVFDSGIGGLTVVSALRNLLPCESVIYIGDTARVPYGGKSRETVERYSVEIAGLLLAEGAKMIIVACNTASALAVPRLKELIRVPVLGVVEPGAQAAVDSTRNGRIGVIGTRATIRSKAYNSAIHHIQPDAEVFTAECPLLVPLIEEGWLEDSVTDSIIARYLEPLLCENIDTLVLGCTHYPLLRDAIARQAGPGITLVDSAENCARAVATMLDPEPAVNPGSLEVALTDPSERFLRIAAEILHLNVGTVGLRTVQGVAQG